MGQYLLFIQHFLLIIYFLNTQEYEIMNYKIMNWLHTFDGYNNEELNLKMNGKF